MYHLRIHNSEHRRLGLELPRGGRRRELRVRRPRASRRRRARRVAAGRRAVVLTARCHQRATWRYRRELGAEVWLPADAAAADEEPDRRYAEGDTLPGGLLVEITPGPEWPHYSFVRAAAPGVLFCSDLTRPRRSRHPALHPVRVPRGPRRDAPQRRAPARSALHRALPRPRRSARRRSQGSRAPPARLDLKQTGGRRRLPTAARGDKKMSTTSRGGAAATPAGRRRRRRESHQHATRIPTG